MATAKRQNQPAAPSAAAKKPRKRFPAAERRAQLLAGAAAYFGAHGFAATTRDLAEYLGVTQALLYKYFDSKAALIEAVFDHAMTDRWRPEWRDLIADESRPLRDRLVEFYRAYAGDITEDRMRLMVRAGIDRMQMPQRKSFRLTEHVLMPVSAALRRAAGLPGFEEQPFTRGEREFAMSLHGGVIFICIRKHVYRMDLPDDLDILIEIQVRSFVDGAPETVKAILRGDLGDTLTVPHIDPARRR